MNFENIKRVASSCAVDRQCHQSLLTHISKINRHVNGHWCYPEIPNIRKCGFLWVAASHDLPRESQTFKVKEKVGSTFLHANFSLWRWNSEILSPNFSSDFLMRDSADVRPGIFSTPVSGAVALELCYTRQKKAMNVYKNIIEIFKHFMKILHETLIFFCKEKDPASQGRCMLKPRAEFTNGAAR